MSAIDVAARPIVARWPSLHLTGFPSLERLLFIGTLAVAVGLIFLAPRLPLTDLPQHAAQVTLWRDLILGRSAWTDLVRINLVTPYLIGYGLTLPLTFVLSVETAVRVTLSAGLLGFVAGCIALRRRFGGDPQLDWLFPVGFFGFAWQWGFFTFLVASPVALLFLCVVHRACEEPRWTRQTLVVLVGAMLLLAHGLLFAAFLPIGTALVLWSARRQRIREIARQLAPLAALAGLCLVFRLASAHLAGAMRYDGILFGSDPWLKPVALLLYVTNTDLRAARIELPLTFLLLLVPLILRCRLNTGLPIVLFVAFGIVVLAMPSYAFQTALLFHRFALFLLPFYALMFRQPLTGTTGTPRWKFLVPLLVCGVVFGTQGERIWAFRTEARTFDTVLAAAEPGKRALSLVFDRASAGAANATAYLHFPLWYQADKGGFVDFNFADFHPQVVRFQLDRRPEAAVELGWHPDRYDGQPDQARLYDYIFVRGTAMDVAHVIGVSACPLSIKAADEPWFLLERALCPDLDLRTAKTKTN